MPLQEYPSIEALKELVGQEVSVSDWFEITQERINQFAEATEDRQWIHVDEARCRAESPFGSTIAHGFLTISLLPHLDGCSFRINQEFKMVINYGFNKLRFMSAVPAGSRIRLRKTLGAAFEVEGGWQLAFKFTVDIEGSRKPACMGELVTRFITGSGGND